MLIHRRRIGKSFRNEVQLSHGVVIEPVEHEHIGGHMPLTISLGNVQHFFLCNVALLALHKPVGSFRQHWSCTGQQTIAGVNFVNVVAGDHEERNPIAHLRNPVRLLVEAGLDRRF